VFRQAEVAHRLGGSVVRLPGWLVFIVFVPLQIWLFLHLKDAWGWWWTIASFMALGLMGARAARAPWLTSMLFPSHAMRHEMRRHVFQGILFLLAALTWLAPQAVAAGVAPSAWAAHVPQPWLPLALLVTLLKAAVR
jgi:hypothetical protein